MRFILQYVFKQYRSDDTYCDIHVTLGQDEYRGTEQELP
jgi:hypothetical protein